MSFLLTIAMIKLFQNSSLSYSPKLKNSCKMLIPAINACHHNILTFKSFVHSKVQQPDAPVQVII